MTVEHGPRLGILGGTFNPPHLGHLALARHALESLELSRVTLVPANMPPHKRTEQDPGGEHRLAMCRLLIAGSPGLEASAIELARDGPSYTVDTLREIRVEHPDAPLTFVLGADVALTLPGWREPAELLELAEIAVAERDDVERERLTRTLAPLQATGRIRFLRMPAIDVSSSAVRARLAEGEPVEELVGEPLSSYIAEHGLYRAGAGEP